MWLNTYFLYVSAAASEFLDRNTHESPFRLLILTLSLCSSIINEIIDLYFTTRMIDYFESFVLLFIFQSFEIEKIELNWFDSSWQ